MTHWQKLMAELDDCIRETEADITRHGEAKEYNKVVENASMLLSLLRARRMLEEIVKL